MFKELGWATYSAATGGSFTLASGTANYVAVARQIQGMCSAAGSVRIGYATGLGDVAWGAFQPAAGVPFFFENYSSPATANANQALVLNLGDGVGTNWVVVGFEFIKSSGTTS